MAAPTRTKPGRQTQTRVVDSDSRVLGYEQYVNEQVRSTARSVRAMDVSLSILRLVVGLLVVLLGAAVLEHWVLPGGLAGWQRYLVFGGLTAAAFAWAVRDLWPLVARGINPLYAAQTIEQASPSLKNSLINLLLRRAGLCPARPAAKGPAPPTRRRPRSARRT
ncbi:MAG: hypothetical protein AAGJ46_14235, partial [Planctomycetota bacterium]